MVVAKDARMRRSDQRRGASMADFESFDNASINDCRNHSVWRRTRRL